MCSVHRFVAACLIAAGMLVAAGCGGSSVRVRGKVTLDGTPVEAGAITFVPEDKSKGQSAGGTITAGAYQLDGAGALPGTYRVEIKSPKKTGKKVPAGSPSPPGTMVEETVEAIPARYNTKSDLKRELKPGDNVFDFELTSTGK